MLDQCSKPGAIHIYCDLVVLVVSKLVISIIMGNGDY